MADNAKTWIEFEVLQCEEAGFRVAGESEAVGWLSFDIRQPRYPRRSADITIIHSPGPTPGSAGSSASQDGASPSPNETTRKSFSNNMIGALVVRSREKSAIVRADSPIGVFEYWQTWTVGDHTEPEGYKISVDIATEDFDRLQNWAFSGRHPSLITIHTPDISYNYIGDYRVLEWEISGTFGRAAIFDISFEYNPSPLPVIVISDEDSFAKQERTEAESETRQAIANVVDKTASIAAELRGVNSQLRTLIAVVIALACLLVFWSWGHWR